MTFARQRSGRDGAESGQPLQLKIFAVAVTAACFFALTASGMTITQLTAEDHGSEGYRLRLAGPLDVGDADKMRDFLSALKGRQTSSASALATIELDSPGGVLDEGMQMGRLFRQFGVTTLVRSNARCFSACALAFLGGATVKAVEIVPSRRLEIGGQLGFHAFWAARSNRTADAAYSHEKGVAEGRAASALVLQYATEMGADSGLIARTLLRPPEDITYIETVAEFAALGACPVALLPPATDPVRQAVNLCSNATAGLLVSWSDEIHEYTPQEARRLLLGEVGLGIANANVQKGLGARLNEILKSSTEKTKELVYAELMAAGVHLPILLGRTFLMEDVRMGPRALECMASLSPSDPSQYGIVLISRRGLAEPPRAAPRNCPELFLHAPDSLINPHRARHR